ncbi:MAG: peptide chain release factor 2 [Bacilli bacterium]|nr:peptide chain release factor 2 [Bacilli bacterium]
METKDIEKKLTYYLDVLNDIGVKLEIDFKNKRVSELEKITSDSSFWNDMEGAKNILGELKGLKDICTKYNNLYSSINTLIEMFELELNEEDLNSIILEVSKIDEELEKLKLFVLLSGEFDSNNAYVEIHSGAGGTESNDWANMLLRMYTRYFDKNDYKYEIISRQDGEEVGIKGCTLLVKGYYAYGYLKGETGVHRLVRISPFDSNSRRHTSFASVLVTPEINKKLEVEIKDSDLRIDVYRSSGCGGQGVNTTDSAVRITHIPTGIVTSSQMERSQLRNKEIALEMLKNKLYILNQKEFNDKIKNLKGDVMDVNFGSAVRSYVMCPYTLVKDTRTNYETSNVDKVLDGDIQDFLEEYLKK